MARKRGGVPAPIALLIVIIFCLTAYLGAYLIRHKPAAAKYSYRTYEAQSVRELKVDRDCFVYYDGTSLVCVGDDARLRWSHLLGGSATFNVSDYGIAAWVGKKLTLINPANGETVYSGSMEEDILSVTMGDEYVGVVLAPEHDSTIVIMDRAGRRVNSITMAGRTVIQSGFFSKGSLMWVMSLNTTGTTPNCTISTYRPGKEIVGSISDMEQLVYNVVFRNNAFRCTGDSWIKVFDYTGVNEEKDLRKLVYGWFLADVDERGNDAMMAFVPVEQYAQEGQLQDLRMIRDRLDQQIRMPFPCKKLVARGDRVYGFSTDGLIMTAEQNKTQVISYRLPFAVADIYGVTDNDIAVLGNGNTLYLVNLR